MRDPTSAPVSRDAGGTARDRGGTPGALTGPLCPDWVAFVEASRTGRLDCSGGTVILGLEEFGLVAGRMGSVGEKAHDCGGLRVMREIPQVDPFADSC